MDEEEHTELIKYIIQRLLLAIPTLFLVSITVFFLLRVMPGDVATLLVAQDSGVINLEERDRVAEQLGLNDPLYEQYAEWVWGMVRLDPGNSFFTDRPIFGDIKQRLPVTLQLDISSLILGVVVGVPLGTISAVKRNTPVDGGVGLLASIGQSTPAFWSGSLVLLFTSRVVGWTPPFGYVEIWEDPIRNLQQFAIPVLVLGLFMAAIIARLTRSALLEALGQDYIRTARSKGLRERFIIVRHALRNALLPLVTTLGVFFTLLLSGTVILENMFSLPGIGQMLVNGVRFRDFPVVEAIVMLIAVLVLVVNLLTDLAYGFIDPRVRLT